MLNTSNVLLTQLPGPPHPNRANDIILLRQHIAKYNATSITNCATINIPTVASSRQCQVAVSISVDAFS